jgi:F420-dependent oxidoreductase-like protein
MRLCAFVEPHAGSTYDVLLRFARAAEDCGFEGFFIADHYHPTDSSSDGMPGPTDAWITLAAMSRETSRMRLGTLVSSATFRLPGPLAVIVAQVDHMSGGRVELGLGAGWFEPEHRAYGIPFPSAGDRFDRLDEQLAIITGLWATPGTSRFSFRGSHYTIVDSPALPKPVQSPRLPVIVGGLGLRRTPHIAARHADQFNVPFASLAQTQQSYAAMREACDERRRDPRGSFPLSLSSAQTICCGRSDFEVRRRAEALGGDSDTSRTRGVFGTPSEVVDTIGRYAEVGASRMFLRFGDLHDLEHLETVASSVIPSLTSGG